MLSEKALKQVHGGWYIDLSGFFASAGGVIGNFIFSGAFGHYDAHDSSGHYGRVDKVEAQVKPKGFGKLVDARSEHITVLNSDHIEDLNGARMIVGVTASLPPVVQDGIRGNGLKLNNLFGLIAPNGVGAEVSVPIITASGKYDTALISVSAFNEIDAGLKTGNGYHLTGVEVYAGVSLANAKVDRVDELENALYKDDHK